ncbi:MAG TPA: SymE family type I addiction module toxin [Thermoanaerobaculia bacterium]
MPYSRMSGRWLEEHGFAIGSGVRVVVEHGPRAARRRPAVC